MWSPTLSSSPVESSDLVISPAGSWVWCGPTLIQHGSVPQSGAVSVSSTAPDSRWYKSDMRGWRRTLLILDLFIAV